MRYIYVSNNDINMSFSRSSEGKHLSLQFPILFPLYFDTAFLNHFFVHALNHFCKSCLIVFLLALAFHPDHCILVLFEGIFPLCRSGQLGAMGGYVLKTMPRRCSRLRTNPGSHYVWVTSLSLMFT